MNTEITSYDPVKAALAGLTKNYKDVIFNVKTAEGLADAKACYKEINGFSIILENARVKEKAAALAYGKFIDAEAKKISAELDALRLPIKDQIETETKREEREKAAKALADAEKIAAIEAAEKAEAEAKLRADQETLRKGQEALAKGAEAIAEAARLAAEKIAAEERAAAIARQKAKSSHDLEDGRALLTTFVEQFGEKEEFKDIARMISNFLNA